MWRLALSFLLLLALGASFAFSVNQTEPVAVDLAIVRQGDISTTIDLTGTVINDKTVTLTAQLNGELRHVHAREGSVVKAAGVLAELDDREAKALRNKARAELAYQQLAIQSAKINHLRLSRMSSEGNTSRQAVDDSEIRIHSIEAQIKIAESDLVISELQLEHAAVKAPFDGTIIEQLVEQGQWVEAGNRLFTLVARDGNVIEAEVDAGDSNRVTSGQDAVLKLEAWPDKQWHSTVSWIAPAVTREEDKPTNTFAIRVNPPADMPALMLGEQLDVELVTELRKDVLLLPVQALIQDTADSYKVYLVDADQAREVAVEVGLQSINSAQILSGLNAGDQVILPAGTAIENGISVTVR